MFEPLTYEEAWAQQDDLEAICAEGEPAKREIIAENTFYGHDLIVKRYAGLEADRPLRVLLPHGLCLGLRGTWRPIERLPVVGYYAADGAAYMRWHGVRNEVWGLPAPYLLLRRLLGPQGPGDRRGTIFFPSHSVPGKQARHDLALAIERLESLGDAYQPITVCMFFVDLRLGRHRPFERAGMRIVTAGNSQDPQFLARFHHLCAPHAYAASNDIGSNNLYAIESGCRYVDLGLPSLHEQDARSRAVGESLRRISGQPRQVQRQVAGFHLGPDHLRDPVEMRDQLLLAERLDLLGVAARRSRGRRRLHVSRPWRPWRVRRWVLPRLGIAI